MTFAELPRRIESAKRVRKAQAQERASFDYALADLIGRSVSRIYQANNTMPSLYDAYPSLFDSEEIEVQRQNRAAELSAARFRQFADMHNKKFSERGMKADE